MGQTPTANYFPALTGLRALAAWLVFFHHIPVGNSVLRGVLHQGFIGVSIFFVLSGVLIAHKYYDKNTLNHAFLKRYYVARLIRIYPAFFLIVSASFLLYYAFGKVKSYSFKLYFLNISFLKGFSDVYKFTGVSQSWSLTVEVCFYLLAPFVFYLHKKHYFYVRTILILLIFGYFLYLIGSASGLFFQNVHFAIYYTFWGYILDFFAGFGLFLVLNTTLITTKLKLFTNVGLVGIFLSMLLLYLVEISTFYESSICYFLIHRFVVPIATASLIYGLVTEKTLMSRLLSRSFFQVLGHSSYIFYLIHIGILSKMLSWLNWFEYFILVTFLSTMCHKLIEKPIQNALKKWCV